MSTPYKNTKMSGDIMVYRNMNRSERSKVKQEIKNDWISDLKKEGSDLLPFILDILKTDFDVTMARVKYKGLALSKASNE